jgi:Kef-type K+ transport system membrane component KefB
MHEELLSLPFRDPVFVLATALAVTFVVPLLSERLRVPGVVGLILAGILVGPHGLNLIDRDRPMVLLATVGLLFVMFIAGLELDLDTFKKHRRHAAVFGVLCFLVPQCLGTLLGLRLGFGLPVALLLGAVVAPHTLLAYPIASRLGITKRLAITTAIAGTILTDTLALLMPSVVSGVQSGSLSVWFGLRLLGALALFAGVSFWGVPRLGRWLLHHVGLQRDQEVAFIVTIMVAMALFAKLLGIEAIVGAFAAGLTLNHLVPEGSPLMARVQLVGNSLFIPFFLLATGMLVDWRALLSDPRSWLVATGIVVAAVAGKWLASWATGLLFGYTPDERQAMFGLTVPHAAATLAVAMSGVKLGLFGPDIINGVIVMMLCTCLLGAFVTQRFGQKVAVAAEQTGLSTAREEVLA